MEQPAWEKAPSEASTRAKWSGRQSGRPEISADIFFSEVARCWLEIAQDSCKGLGAVVPGSGLAYVDLLKPSKGSSTPRGTTSLSPLSLAMSSPKGTFSPVTALSIFSLHE